MKKVTYWDTNTNVRKGQTQFIVLVLKLGVNTTTKYYDLGEDFDSLRESVL